jgi:serine/threonine-protein kinase HipA
MTRIADVFVKENFAGTLTETTEGEYILQYDAAYCTNAKTQAISLTLPKTEQPYISKTLFPFFDGLIPEGWLMEIGVKSWKISPHDRMGLLLHLCRDCIGTISIAQKVD